jgi:predicted transcriptional regulator
VDADIKRDLVRKAILLQIKNGYSRYTDIKDVVTAKCKDFASSNTMKKQFYKYLIPQEYIERIKPGKYKLTQKGERLLAILSESSNQNNEQYL